MLPQASPASWNLQAAGHLMNRAGFGGTPHEIAQFQKLGRQEAVESLFLPPPATPGPELSDPAQIDQMTEGIALKTPEERQAILKEISRLNFADLANAREWWIRQMSLTASAPLEKAVLFWHGHFATSVQKVKSARMMVQQNALFRQFAFGNFVDLVKAISCDPAMVVWLDLQQSRKGTPNENFSRELMELFTLGVGHYSEDDIKESARAFTGYRTQRREGGFTYLAEQHDAGDKTFLGKKGPFAGDDIIDLIARQPACAEFICRKLWTFYAYEEPEPAIVSALATTLWNGNYEIRPVLREMFHSAAFYSAKAVASQIKSPVQFIVQGCRELECDPPSGQPLEGAMRVLGQILFAPPNVKGWDGNRSWINTSTLDLRNQFSNQLVKAAAPRPGFPGVIPLERLVTDDMLNHPEPLIDQLSRRLLSVPLSHEDRSKLVARAAAYPKPLTRTAVRDILIRIMQLPEYQIT